MPPRLRVFLSGQMSDEIEGLRQRLAADANLELVDRMVHADAVVTLPPAARHEEPLMESLTARSKFARPCACKSNTAPP